jgi:hypothetical protein
MRLHGRPPAENDLSPEWREASGGYNRVPTYGVVYFPVGGVVLTTLPTQEDISMLVAEVVGSVDNIAVDRKQREIVCFCGFRSFG